MNHSPAYVMQKVLVALGVGGAPATPQPSWPIYVSSEPDLPDNCITVYTTQGRDQGDLFPTGEAVQFQGIQIRIRCITEETGYAKAHEIRTALAEDLDKMTVHVGADLYLVTNAEQVGQVLPIGYETPKSKRRVFTLNLIVSIDLVQ